MSPNSSPARALKGQHVCVWNNVIWCCADECRFVTICHINRLNCNRLLCDRPVSQCHQWLINLSRVLEPVVRIVMHSRTRTRTHVHIHTHSRTLTRWNTAHVQWRIYKNSSQLQITAGPGCNTGLGFLIVCIYMKVVLYYGRAVKQI